MGFSLMTFIAMTMHHALHLARALVRSRNPCRQVPESVGEGRGEGGRRRPVRRGRGEEAGQRAEAVRGRVPVQGVRAVLGVDVGRSGRAEEVRRKLRALHPLPGDMSGVGRGEVTTPPVPEPIDVVDAPGVHAAVTSFEASARSLLGLCEAATGARALPAHVAGHE